jgi:hypothetical protein
VSIEAPSTRRDTRHAIRPGSSFVEFAHPDGQEPVRAALTRISIAGFAFQFEGPLHDFQPETCLPGLRLHVGPCVLEGQAVVRSIISTHASGGEVGCLFHPETRESEERWMALIAGIEAVQGV